MKNQSTTSVTWGRVPFGRQDWLTAALFLLVGFAIYYPALNGEFIWDDEKIYIVDNELLREADGIYKFWFSNEPVDYLPLTYTTFWLEWQVAGINPLLYHITNVICHAATAFALYLLFEELKVPWAFWLSMLFLAHPIQVESVAWISQRKTVLSVLFGVLACYLYVRQRSKPQWLTQIGAPLCFVLSVAAKPTLITLPVALAVVEFWVARATVLEMSRRLWPYFAISIVLGAIGVVYQQKLIDCVDVREQSFVERLMTMSWAFLFYIHQLFSVWTLNFVYPRWVVSATSFFDWLPSLLVLVISCGLWRFRKAWGVEPIAAWCVAWITLFPSLGLVDVFYWRYSYVGDHYVYQSVPAFLAMLAYLLHKPFARLGSWPQLVVAAGLVIPLAITSFSRAQLYESPQRLWEETLKENPRAGVAWWTLGAIEQSAARLHKAIEVQPSLFEVWLQLANLALTQRDDAAALNYFIQGELAAPVESSEHLSCLIGQAALYTRFQDVDKGHEVLQQIERRAAAGELIDPIPSASRLSLEAVRLCFAAMLDRISNKQAIDLGKAIGELVETTSESNTTTVGQICEDCGAIDAAIFAYQSRLRRDPKHLASLAAVGRCYIELQRFDEAEFFLRKAIETGDSSVETQISLGVVLMNMGKMADGLEVFETAARDNRLYFRLWSNLGLAYIVNGRPLDAHRAWSTALEINPDDVSTLRDAAWLAATNEQLASQPKAIESAIRQATRAWELSGQTRPDCLDALAAALASAGKFREAEDALRTAIQLSETIGAPSTNIEDLRQRLSLFASDRVYRE